MEGVYFYWIGWIYICIVTFFWNKTSLRTASAIFLFITLIVSPIYIPVFSSEVSLGFLFLIGVSYGFISQVKVMRLLHIVIAVLAVAAAYATFQLVAIYDPVVHLIDGRLMSMAIVVCLSCMLAGKWSLRILIAVVGLLHGELLYGLAAIQTFTSHAFGSFYVLDVLALSTAVIGGGWLLHMLSEHVGEWIKQRKHQPIRNMIAQEDRIE
ncbi:hypothetical protein BTR22_05365 [Alkalihalophilus pseudofirmus]|uniref:YphA family membrane protein n=1 Tax=Alkalihalophilus pseudofirmus TaxID=79885 RepID=UPI000952D772|nr:hypothetical protein BTR22_05365 [Alkalihalophilus pseudofirmus]